MVEPGERPKDVDNIITFLIEDLKDTSEHLRATDKKTEFVFQIIVGGFVAIASASLILLQRLVEKNQTESFVQIMNQMDNFVKIVIALIIVILGCISVWAFDLVLRGYCEKNRYVNRMNYLRRQIHLRGNSNILETNRPFLYIDKLEIQRKLGRGISNLFLIALYTLSALLFALAWFYILKSFSTINTWYEFISSILVLIVVIGLLKCRKRKIFNKLDEEINGSWKSED